MRERTLLEKALVEKEILKENEPQKEQKLDEQKSKSEIPAIKLARLRQMYKSEKDDEPLAESKVVSVVEKPNYDQLEVLTESERKKIFKIEKKQTSSLKPNRLKYYIVGILIAIFGIWGIVNIATIDNVSSQIAEVSTQYQMNLATYLRNLQALDATNSENMKNLFETIPEEGGSVTQIQEKSNWFDRFCNFIEGLFGG